MTNDNILQIHNLIFLALSFNWQSMSTSFVYLVCRAFFNQHLGRLWCNIYRFCQTTRRLDISKTQTTCLWYMRIAMDRPLVARRTLNDF